MKICLTILFFLCFCAKTFAQQGYDTVKVYFPINIITLDQATKELLDSVAKIAQHSNLLIYGYADYLGNEAANLDLAKGRANNVKRYLIDKNISPSQILVCDGIGQVNRNLEKNKEGFPEDRRVGIFIKRGSIVEKPIAITKGKNKTMKVAEFTPKGNLIPLKKPKPSKKNDSILTAQKILDPAIKTKNGIEKLAILKPNEVLRLEMIHFLPTRHYLTQDSEPIVLELLQTMKNFPKLAIRIEGHVCCVKDTSDALDTDTYELKLSVNRAKYIYRILVSNGISKDRLEYAGYAKRRPIVPFEKTEEDAQINRRVEIRVLRNDFSE